MHITQENSTIRPKLRPVFGKQYSWRLGKDLTANGLMKTMALIAVLLPLIVAMLLLVRAWPLLAVYPLPQLLTSTEWQPGHGHFGMAPFIAGSLMVTLLAGVIAVPPAIFSGIYLSEYTSTRTRALLKPLLELLAGIPSVVYGLWGILFVVPIIRDYVGPWTTSVFGHSIPFLAQTNPSGYGVLAGGFVLGVMIFPVIVSVMEEVLHSVPREMREALLALGATRWETTKCVVRRRGLAGMLAAIVLGFSRAFGETLAVMMVVGNTIKIPTSIFDAAYPLPALIANNYGEMMSVPLYDSALMAAALILLIVVLFFNLLARFIIVRLTGGSVK
jgi:phosphate transport system permease protein